ncbi:MAG: methyltransferase domain-containing protein [Candidatus Heimdallarchaeota archaeon]|nr:MAG: methyltransferase domain-containing protein [Candidatus Heimdallarchaeota archaeon]
MLKEGDIVLITEISSRHPKSWLLSLAKDTELSTHLGKIFHNQIIGKKYGEVIILTKGKAIIMKPSPRDYLRQFKLKTQILYEDDCAIACSLAGVGSSMKVGEAGTGSGALTMFLAYNVQPSGHVFSYEINEDHLANAQKNLAKTGMTDVVTFKLQDIRLPIEECEFDAFFLDFSSPYEAIDTVAIVLRGGGHLVCFVPNWGQVEKTVAQIRKCPYLIHRETFEITRRNFIVNPNNHIMRPVFRDLVYSGILIHAIRINPD